MRESIGGAFQFNLVLIFLGVYIAVLAFAVVYARAFNSKNHVITLLEQYEGYDNASTAINDYMASRSSGIVNQDCNYTCNKLYSEAICNSADIEKITGGCIFEFTDNNSRGHYYAVATFMRVDIPIISALSGYFPISGETKVIYNRVK